MELLPLTTDPTSTTVLPAVHLVPVKVRSAAPGPASLVTAGPYDLLLLDARHDLAGRPHTVPAAGSGRARGAHPCTSAPDRCQG